MLAIHPNARTTPAVRAEIARSAEPTGELAKRYGVSTETVRKWRKRGPAECRDRCSRPHKLPWKASEEERAVVWELRRATGFPLDDLAFVVRHFLPHLDRDNVYRILKAAGLSRRPAPARPETPASKFKEMAHPSGSCRATGCAGARGRWMGWPSCHDRCRSSRRASLMTRRAPAGCSRSAGRTGSAARPAGTTRPGSWAASG